MKVEDIMRTGFLSFQADDKLEHIVKEFAKARITSAPVFDNGEFVGMVGDAEIVRYFTPKKFSFLWKKDKPTPIEELKKTTAIRMARKPPMFLLAGQEVGNVLEKIAKMGGCIPVVGKGKIVGVVYGEDIVNFFLREFAKAEYGTVVRKQEGEENDGGQNKEMVMGTEIDSILDMVKKHGAVPVSKVARELGMSAKSVEKVGEILDRHHIIKIEYSFFKGAILRMVKNEK